jgi:aminopeptidase N
MKVIKTVFLLLFILSLNSSAQKTDIYERPVQVERSHDFDALHYRLTLFFDLEKKEFHGENRVTLKPLKNGFNECVLDAQDLVITEVTDNSNIPLEFKHADQKLSINFSREYNYGDEVIFTIKYHAIH